MARLGELFVHIRNGANIKQGVDDGGYPITRIETISNRKVDRNKMGYAGITDLKKYSDYIMQDGDILMSHINSEIHLGKTALYQKEGTETIIHGMNLLSLRPKKDLITSKYAFYYLSSQSFLRQIPNITKKSVNQASFNVSALKELSFPVIPIGEQNQIVDSLEKTDRLISLRKQQLAKLDELVKARFVELFEKEEYKKVTVSSVLNTGFWLMPATPEFIVDGEVPYITSKNIKNRTIDFDNVKYISREAYKSISANRPTQKGDILISMIGTLGQTAVIQDDREFYGQNLYLLRLNNSIVNTTYFCEFFNSDTAQHELQGKRNQSTQAYLKANHVEDLILPLPPIELQNQFAIFVEQIDKSKSAIQQSLDKLETLKGALMQKYFG